MKPGHYHTSAYNSGQLPPLAPAAQVKGAAKLTQAMSKKLPWSQRYSQLVPLEMIESGLREPLSWRKKGRFINHQRWGTQLTPWYAVIIQMFLIVFSFGVHALGIAGILLVGDIIVSIAHNEFLPTFFLYCGYLLICLLMTYVITPLLPSWLMTKDAGTGLFRETGMVKVKHNWSLMEYPFVEFDCHIMHHPTSHGQILKTLTLYHRYKPEINLGLKVMPLGDGSDTSYYMAWEVVQRYMDVTQPLPDIPQLEAFRALDPTTVAFDKTHPREPEYWTQMKVKQWKDSKEKKALQKQIAGFNWNRPCKIEKHIAKGNEAA